MAAVAGDRRVELEVIGLRGQPPRLAVGQVLDVQVSERLVDRLVALGGDDGPAEHAHVEL
jgi:hypothetical protein